MTDAGRLDDRSERLRQEVAEWRGKAERAKAEVSAVLDTIPGGVRVREGGGAEDVLASLAVSVALLRGRIEAAEATLNERATALDSALADATRLLSERDEALAALVVEKQARKSAGEIATMNANRWAEWQQRAEQAEERVRTLDGVAVRASAELRHTYRPETRDWALVARAITILETATTPAYGARDSHGHREGATPAPGDESNPPPEPTTAEAFDNLRRALAGGYSTVPPRYADSLALLERRTGAMSRAVEEARDLLGETSDNATKAWRLLNAALTGAPPGISCAHGQADSEPCDDCARVQEMPGTIDAPPVFTLGEVREAMLRTGADADSIQEGCTLLSALRSTGGDK